MSSQVGSGHVAIFPTMVGFKSKVSKEIKSAGSASARDFSSSMKGAGAATGARLGRDMKSALTASTRDMGAASLSSLNRDVAAASAALSKSRLRQQDDAGKVRVAEARLAEQVEKYGESSSQAVAAEERLASARRSQQVAVDAVAAATSRLRTAQDALASATAASTPVTEASKTSLRQMLADFRAGATDANAARSAFTGVAGSIGGILRATSDMAGLTKLGGLARDAAARASTAFTSLASTIGGRLARAWQTSAGWMSGIGRTVSTALAPLGRVSATAANAVASPFIKLGSKVSSWMSPLTSQVSGLVSKITATAGPAASRFASSFSTGLSRVGSGVSSALSSVVSAASAVGSKAGAALAAGLKGTATAGVTVLAAGLGIALGSGFSRLTAIDTARAKLTGLGHDGTTVTEVMKNATASVRGTAFGLGEAASVAAGAMAAQIKPGEALQSHLKRVANNAAAAGVSMEEMGSIFNKAATQANGVQNDVISQLADKGIPIYQKLGEQMGVTAGEVFKLASQGKVDFETFSKAAEAAAGTVADEIGKTVPGAFKNMRASIGRIGANLFGGINESGQMFGLYSKLGPLLASITKAFGPVEEGAKTLGATLDRVVGPPIEKVTAFLNRLGEGGDGIKEKLSGLMPVLAPVGAAFLALGSGGLASLLTRIPMLGGMLGGLTGPLAMLGGPLGIAAAAIAAFALSGADAEGLVTGLTGIIDRVVAALPGLIDQVVAVVPKLVEGILGAIPQLLTAATGIVTALIDGIVTALPLIIAGGVQLIDGLITAIIGSLPLIIQGAITLVTALLNGIVAALPLIIQGALTLVSALLSGIVAALPSIIEGGVQLLMALVNGLIAALPLLLSAALQLLSGLITALIENLPLIIEAGIGLLMALVTGLIEALPELISSAITLVLQLVVGLLSMLPELIKAGIELIVALIVGLVDAIPMIVKMLPEIIAAIWDGLMGVDWLDLGVQIVEGIINGLGSMVGAIVEAITDLASAAFDGFKDFFGIKSPAKRMIQPGRDVVRGAVKGVDDQAPSYGDSLVSMAEDAAARAQRAMKSAVISAEVGRVDVARNTAAELGKAVLLGERADGTTVVLEGDSAAFMQWMNVYEMQADGSKKLIYRNGKKVI